MLEVFSTEISAFHPARVTVNCETPKTSEGFVLGYCSFQSSRAVWGGALMVVGTVTACDAQPADARAISATSTETRDGRMTLIVAQERR